jgi:malonyl CoA-acyl carrier protein transacylase
MDDRSALAVLFPGQGSLAAGMAEQVKRTRPDLYELARDSVGCDPFERLGEGTRFDQPAIYCASLAGFETLGRPGGAWYAGHSLGEIAALAAAGAVRAEDGLRVVAARGRLMQEAADAAGPGGMLALRASRSQARQIASGLGLTVANDNSPQQTVLSGEREALEAAGRRADAAGLRAKLLPIAGAFHSPAIESAVAPFRHVLQGVVFSVPRIPVMSCVTAAPFEDPRAELAQALVRPVRWLDVLRSLHSAGARRFLETGPGKVLAGLVRRSLDGVEVLAGSEVARA